MELIYKKLYDIKAQPTIYIGEKSVLRLRMFLTGYITREMEINEDYSTTFEFFAEFVKDYYKSGYSYGWDTMLNQYEKDDEDAFDKFFELLDVFLNEYNVVKEHYPYGTITTKAEYRSTKTRHYTDHGNSDLFTNPHDHEIYWYPNGSYSYGPPLNYHGIVPEL